MKTLMINTVTDEEAYAIVGRELRPVIDRMIRSAHKEGSHGLPARAEKSLRGPLLDAAAQLGDEFERLVRDAVPGNVWKVTFAYTVRNYAPGVIMIRLK